LEGRIGRKYTMGRERQTLTLQRGQWQTEERLNLTKERWEGVVL
jgi:hypothetical protein